MHQAAGSDAERGRDGVQLIWEISLVHVDTDACNDSRVFHLGQDAGAFLGVNQHVVRPAQVAGEMSGFLDGIGGGQSERECDRGDVIRDKGVAQHDRAVQPRTGFGVPGSPVTALPRGLLFGDDHGAGFATFGRQAARLIHGGIYRSMPIDAASRSHCRVLSVARLLSSWAACSARLERSDSTTCGGALPRNLSLASWRSLSAMAFSSCSISLVRRARWMSLSTPGKRSTRSNSGVERTAPL